MINLKNELFSCNEFKCKLSNILKGGKYVQNIEKIYQEYFDTVKKYLFCLTYNEELAEELTQSTFYIAVQKIHTFKGNCEISTWLCQIAKNLWYNELKKNKKYVDVNDDFLLKFESIHSIEETVISTENKLELYKKIQKLDEQTRDVIYLRITGELSFKEIADILNKSENWARITFYRGKQKLKEVNENGKRM